MIDLLAAAKAPEIDFQGLSPLIAIVGGSVVVTLAGLIRGPFAQRTLVPLLTVASLCTAIGLTIANWQPGDLAPIIEGALAVDTLALSLSMLFYVAGLATVALSLRAGVTSEAGAGEYFALLLGSIAGMVVLAAAENLVTLFVGIELLSIPLYVLCAAELRKAPSLEAGLKYLVVGSVGSATLLYGLALIYGATGSTDFSGIADAIGDTVSAGDPLLLTGVALAATGLAFKASVAPFHQWTPDVYQGAPTPITTFMAVATKAAAFAVILRLFDHALPSVQPNWGPALAALATATILIGNAGAIAQRSLKRMLAWSGVAQAGYLLAGVVVGTPARTSGHRLLPGRLPAHERGGLRRGDRPRAGVGAWATTYDSLRDLGAGEPGAGVADDDRDALARRLPCHRGLHRQVLLDRRLRGGRLRLARES